MKPKEELFLVIKPSRIEGVGVFTERLIRKGEYVRLFGYERNILVVKPEGRLKMMCDRFAVLTKSGKYYRPKSFIQMSLAWYLNHSTKPNLEQRRGWFFYAIRNIRKGEELTVDYSSLDKNVDNSKTIQKH